MSTNDTATVTTIEQVQALPAGQWAIDADGRALCVFDTHIGFPQRMLGMKGEGGTRGHVTSFTNLRNAVLPLRLADIKPGQRCGHRRANECGQCTACGRPGAQDAAPLYVEQVGL